MIDENAVLKEFEALSGLPPLECAKQRFVCHLCCINVYERLKNDGFERDERIINLAAALCFYTYTLRNSGEDENITSIKSGDITVATDNTIAAEKSKKLKEEAEAFAAPLLKDADFVFCGV